MKPLLLASNPSPFAVESDDAPRWDAAELVRVLNAAVLYPPPKCGGMGAVAGALEEKTASDVRQAWAAFRRRSETSVYLSLSEKGGLPLAALLAQSGRGWGERGRVPHVMIAHHLTSRKKRLLQTRTGYLKNFDKIIVLCQTQARYLIDEAGVSPDRVHFTYDKVDHHFWTPGGADPAPDRGPIVAVGRERRDYPTLVEAVRSFTDREVIIVASSPWARQGSGGGDPAALPLSHVQWKGGLSFAELREWYRRAFVVVVPLQTGTDYAAGVNAVLEAMAMGKPLIVSDTPGIADYVEDNHNCRVVPPGDTVALRAALDALYRNPDEAAQLGANARQTVQKGRNLDAYVDAVRRVVCEAAPC